jgi:anti-sigma B factor antagonist
VIPDEEPTLSLTTTRSPHAAVVTAVGEIDIANAERFRAALLDALATGSSSLHVDMSGVGFCDSSGLRALVAARNACVEQGASFDITAVSDQVGYLLAVVGLTSLREDGSGSPQ